MAQISHRDQLLESAIECLQTKGYARTTARDVAAGANANLASIGYHFGSKEGLLTEALITVSEQWLGDLERLAFEPSDLAPLERLLASFAAMAGVFTRRRPLLAAFVEALAEAERTSDLRHRLAAHYEESRRRVSTLILAAFDDGVPGLSAEQARAASSAIIALGDGFLIQWRLDPEGTPDGAELVAALGEVIALGHRS